MKPSAAFLSVLVALTLLAAPISSDGQQPGKPFKIGVLYVPVSGKAVNLIGRLGELGYVEGRDYTIEYRYADGNYDRLPALAADLVRTRVDLIFVVGNAAAKVVLGATTSIPVVSISCDAFTLVDSLARHEGNLSGVTCMRIELTEKRLALLKETVPTARRIAHLYNPIEGPEALEFAEAAARRLNLTLLPVPVRSIQEFEPALDAIRQQRPDALSVNPDAIIFSRQEQIAKFALQRRLPAINPFSQFVAAGGLMSYGSSGRDLTRRAAELIDKIFKGAKPSELPIEQATRFYLAINLKTAKVLGVTFPPSVRASVDEVIQ